MYLEIAAAELFAVKGRDGCNGFGINGHFHKSKAAPASLAIDDNMNAPELAEGL